MRGWGWGGDIDVWIEADERDVVAALALPFVHSALHVVCSADFQEDGFLVGGNGGSG